MKLSKATARSIVGNARNPDIPWIERWLEQWCRSNSYPLQMIGNDFMTQLGNLLETQQAIVMLQFIRIEYEKCHPFETFKESDFDFLKE